MSRPLRPRPAGPRRRPDGGPARRAKPARDANPVPAAPVRRTPRDARALPAGRYEVPLSTIDWLVSRESPAARYVALRDLLGRPPRDPDLKRAKQALVRDPFVRDSIALLRARLAPGVPPASLERRYDGGLWLALFLTETGADGALPLLHHAGDVLLARWEKPLIAIERHEDARFDPDLLRPALRVLSRVGWGRDPRVLCGAEALAVRALAGRGRTEKDLLLFASLPSDARSERVARATAFLATRLLESELPAALADGAPPELLTPGFPCGDETDLVEMLFALASSLSPEAAADAAAQPTLSAALVRLAARADHRARWKLERPRPDRFPVALERTGELSRWVTLRALAVLQHFRGLEVPGGAPSRRRP